MRRLVVTVFAVVASAVLATPALAEPPRTGFEQRNGASWTTHEEELAFLTAVTAGSMRARSTVLGRTKQGRPLHLVEVSDPLPVGASAGRNRPTAFMVCSQHGNEAAGREACLQLLRDLAFTSDPALVSLLGRTTFLFLPNANPDGRVADTRENSDGIDINRDHMTLATAEARAIATVVRDWQPEVAIDLHEYGPATPVVYDDAVLWLWPRNLNTDQQVHDLAIDLGRRYLVPSAEEAGFTTDEYGQYEVAGNDVAQTAGDADEGILRNAMGLRHVLGILVETRVDGDVRQSPTEVVDAAEVMRRRVASHTAVLRGMLRFLTERGADAARVTSEAAARKAAEGAARSAPVFFGGADNQPPTAEQTVNPPPCGYRLTEAQVASLGPRLDLHGIEMVRVGSGPFVSLAQRSEPLIPLLLDARATRHIAKGEALSTCPALPAPARARCVRPGTVRVRLPRVRGRVVSTTVRADGRRVRVRRGVAMVRVRRGDRTVRVRIVQRVRRGGRVVARRTTRVLRVCR
jgi:hypothetical protein